MMLIDKLVITAEPDQISREHTSLIITVHNGHQRPMSVRQIVHNDDFIGAFDQIMKRTSDQLKQYIEDRRMFSFD